MTIITRFYPNGEFTQGVDTSHKRKVRRLDHLSSKLHNNYAPAVVSDVCAEMNDEICAEMIEPGYTFISAQTSEYVYLCKEHRTYHYAVTPKEGEGYVVESEHSPLRMQKLTGGSSLGLSDARIFTETPKASRKRCLTMSKSMARNIRQACYLLEESYGKNHLSFLTLTLPSLPSEAMTVIHNNWGKLIDQFLKWLRYALEAKGIPLEYTYCTEIQLKRQEKYHESIYHVHLLFRGRKKKSNWAVTPSQIRKAWCRCIQNYYGGDFQQSALENVQRVKKSAERYLSKYLSKGRNHIHPQSANNADTLKPIHWGGIARGVRRIIDRLTLRLTSKTDKSGFCTRFVGSLEWLLERSALQFVRRGFIPLDAGDGNGGERGLHVSVGALKTPTWKGGFSYLLSIMNLTIQEVYP